MARHSWAKLRIHVYICRKCGMGKVNSMGDGGWVATYHGPDGKSEPAQYVPSCERGPLTEKYLAKYAAEIARAAARASEADGRGK